MITMQMITNAALKTCHRHDKMSKKETEVAEKRWKEAVKNVKEEGRAVGRRNLGVRAKSITREKGEEKRTDRINLIK